MGRRFFQYIPFLLPHDKSYYGFAHLVHPGDGLFLDIGANDGISAIGFKHIHSDYRVLSLEPNRNHEAALVRLKKKLKGFDYRIMGAGSRSGQEVLHMPFYQGVPIYTAASLSPDFVRDSMAHQFNGHGKEKLAYVQQIVDIARIDDLGLSPDIIKIDTEGFDYEVLLGAQATISSGRPFVMIEYNPKLVDVQVAFFEQLGYVLWTYMFQDDQFRAFDRRRESALVEMGRISPNIFCIPREKIGNLPFRKEHV